MVKLKQAVLNGKPAVEYSINGRTVQFFQSEKKVSMMRRIMDVAAFLSLEIVAWDADGAVCE